MRLKTLVAYQLIEPGSEWRLHRHSAMGGLLGEGEALVQVIRWHRCLDKLLEHQRAMFSFLRKPWQSLFDVGFEVLLYDLASAYFECDPPEYGKRGLDYSLDKQSGCVQVVIIALDVLAEVMIPLSPSSLQWSTGIGPSKRLAEGIVEIVDEIQDSPAQVGNRVEAGALEHSSREDREPDLDLVKPGAMSWRIDEVNAVLGVS